VDPLGQARGRENVAASGHFNVLKQYFRSFSIWLWK
jgi:hypothetical protein